MQAGKSFSEALILASTNLVIFIYWTCKSMNNLLPYCGLVDARMKASNKDLPVSIQFGYDVPLYINVKGIAIWYYFQFDQYRKTSKPWS